MNQSIACDNAVFFPFFLFIVGDVETTPEFSGICLMTFAWHSVETVISLYSVSQKKRNPTSMLKKIGIGWSNDQKSIWITIYDQFPTEHFKKKSKSKFAFLKFHSLLLKVTIWGNLMGISEHIYVDNFQIASNNIPIDAEFYADFRNVYFHIIILNIP